MLLLELKDLGEKELADLCVAQRRALKEIGALALKNRELADKNKRQPSRLVQDVEEILRGLNRDCEIFRKRALEARGSKKSAEENTEYWQGLAQQFGEDGHITSHTFMLTKRLDSFPTPADTDAVADGEDLQKDIGAGQAGAVSPVVTPAPSAPRKP